MRSTTCYTILGNFIDKYGQRQLNLTEVDDDSECDEEDRPQEIGECNKGMCFYRWAPGAFGPVRTHALFWSCEVYPDLLLVVVADESH